MTSTSNVFAWNRACILTLQLFRPDINAGLFSLSLITRGLDFFCYAWQCEVALDCYYWSITINIIDPFMVRWYACLILEMWANAQRDGRPAEHRWRPLFNAAKFG